MKWQCRWSPTLGELEGTAKETWGTDDYTDQERPTVFFGCYSLADFNIIHQHKGKRAILWCGSDITRLQGGYWLDEKGEIRVDVNSLAKWINKNCENWVENMAEYKVLKAFLGIESQICPSFLGDVNNFTPQIIDPKKRYYSSVSGNDFNLYQWDKIIDLANENPSIEYHLYGNTLPYPCVVANNNVIFHGRVPKEQMNEETKTMTGAIRLLPFEGASEVVLKSILYGQKPISAIDYPFLHSKNPREELLKIINCFPWNTK